MVLKQILFAKPFSAFMGRVGSIQPATPTSTSLPPPKMSPRISHLWQKLKAIKKTLITRVDPVMSHIYWNHSPVYKDESCGLNFHLYILDIRYVLHLRIVLPHFVCDPVKRHRPDNVVLLRGWLPHLTVPSSSFLLRHNSSAYTILHVLQGIHTRIRTNWLNSILPPPIPLPTTVVYLHAPHNCGLPRGTLKILWKEEEEG